MRVAILGTRGVPARYGGFETFAEELGHRLAQRGHHVTVYGRTRWVPAGLKTHRGIRIVRLPAPNSKYLETIVHTLLSALHALTRPYDVVYVCNVANLPSVALLWVAGRRVVLNVDGLEWRRRKWSRLGRAYARICAWTAARLPVQIVTDAVVVQYHYAKTFGRSTTFIPYGTDVGRVEDDGTLARFGLADREYVLYVSRLEPENNAHVVVEAFRNVQTNAVLVVVGDAPHASRYIERVHSLADDRTRFLGAVYGPAYRILQSHAAAYVQATEVGGTHPALLEAMGAGNSIVANDVPEHREVLADAGLYFRNADDLAVQLQRVLSDELLADRLRRAAMDRARESYEWGAISDRYEQWLTALTGAETN